MSWNAELISSDKEKLKKHLQEDLSKNSYQATHIQKIVNAINELIAAMPDNPDVYFEIVTHGHIDTNYGRAVLEVKTRKKENVLI